MAELFKSFRSDVAREAGLKVPVMEHLSDYYHDPAGQVLFQNITQLSSWSMPFEAWTRPELLAKLEARVKTYCGALLPYLKKVNGETYKEIFESLQTSIEEAYGSNNTEAVGFKEVWCGEFVPVLAREYPDMKFVFLVRDPRAVCASKKMQVEQYPWTFLARQWRKLASIQHLLAEDKDLGSRVLSLKYEDFISEPVLTMRRLCAFIGVSYHPDVADPSKYKDGNGKAWVQNTSYGHGGQTLDIEAVQRWRDVLTDREIALIERMCGPEMSLFGYEVETSREVLSDPELICNPPRVPDKSLAKWMAGFVPNDPAAIATQVAADGVRDNLLLLPATKRVGVPEDVVKSAFLSRQVLDALGVPHRD